MTEDVNHANSIHALFKCLYCIYTNFKNYRDFLQHLKEKHSNQEGDIFVCRYGPNGICPISREGENYDFENHVYNHHALIINDTTRIAENKNKENELLSSRYKTEHQPFVLRDTQNWDFYSASQNLSSVLNDPKRGKQMYFFTKTWGDKFLNAAENKETHHSEIKLLYIDDKFKEIAQRYQKHQNLTADLFVSNSTFDLFKNFPSVWAFRVHDKSHFNICNIPMIFLQPNFDLCNPEIFSAVFPFSVENTASGHDHEKYYSRQSSTNLLQKNLSHYLDEVEMQIAQQIACKSNAFLHAMTSQDALSEQLQTTIKKVKILREHIQMIDKSVVKESLNILRLQRQNRNRFLIFRKLKLMATVHKAQPTIQLLLATPDYLGALELISRTQEILNQDLVEINCFRHLGPQLLEIEKLVDKMVKEEFKLCVTADLKRPLCDNQQVISFDEFGSIVHGLFKLKYFHFLDKYKEEVYSTMEDVTSPMFTLIEEASYLGRQCFVSDDQDDQNERLSSYDWIDLLKKITTSLAQIIYRVKHIHDFIRSIADINVSKTTACLSSVNNSESLLVGIHLHEKRVREYKFLQEEEHKTGCVNLQAFLTSICDFALNKVVKFVASIDRKSQGIPSIIERVSASELDVILNVSQGFTEKCEEVCGRKSSALSFSVEVQVSTFIRRFHQDHKEKLNLLLNSERWKQTDVPSEFQDFVDHINNTRIPNFMELRTGGSSEMKPSKFLMIDEERFAVIGTVLLLLKMVAEYCSCAKELPTMADNLYHNLVELLLLFNSRCFKLILGAGALHVAGLQTITTTNLALTSRSLHLLLWLIPRVKTHFQCLLEIHHSSFAADEIIGELDNVMKHIQNHCKEVDDKILALISTIVMNQLTNWDAKLPVPSFAFASISKQIIKFHEAVGCVLPDSQVLSIIKNLHETFKTSLREKLLKINIVNDGGPHQGAVIAELTFYLETLKILKVLPNEELTVESMNDIWNK